MPLIGSNRYFVVSFFIEHRTYFRDIYIYIDTCLCGVKEGLSPLKRKGYYVSIGNGRILWPGIQYVDLISTDAQDVCMGQNGFFL